MYGACHASFRRAVELPEVWVMKPDEVRDVLEGYAATGREAISKGD